MFFIGDEVLGNDLAGAVSRAFGLGFIEADGQAPCGGLWVNREVTTNGQLVVTTQGFGERMLPGFCKEVEVTSCPVGQCPSPEVYFWVHEVTLVTRHPALADLVREKGFNVVETLSHATPDDVRDKHVIGNIPLHLAKLAKTVTAPTLALEPEHRGVELDLETLRSVFAGFESYIVS